MLSYVQSRSFSWSKFSWGVQGRQFLKTTTFGLIQQLIDFWYLKYLLNTKVRFPRIRYWLLFFSLRVTVGFTLSKGKKAIVMQAIVNTKSIYIYPVHLYSNIPCQKVIVCFILVILLLTFWIDMGAKKCQLYSFSADLSFSKTKITDARDYVKDMTVFQKNFIFIIRQNFSCYLFALPVVSSI